MFPLVAPSLTSCNGDITAMKTSTNTDWNHYISGESAFDFFLLKRKTKQIITYYNTHFRKGYECIKILIAIFLNGLKGLKIYMEGLALNLKIVFPLFNTIKVCRKKKRKAMVTTAIFPQQHSVIFEACIVLVPNIP